MTDLRLGLHPYRLPLRRPWRTARGVLHERAGWLVRAACDGAVGCGDCAPLPEAGTETAAAAVQRLQHWCGRAGDGIAGLLAALEAEPGAAPAADCALETALLDLSARRNGLPLRRLLEPKALTRPAVNAMLGAAATLDDARVEAALAAGFRVLKLKLGTAALDQELRRIQAAARLLPAGVTLRLDANGAWDAATAASGIARLAGLPIDCLEEPLAVPDDHALGRLQDAAPFSLALDESLTGRVDLDPCCLPVRRLVLKPAAVGGLRRALRLAARARAAGREVVVTGLVESAAGLWATAHLAAATGSELAHGLATADWLTADLGAPPVIAHGRLDLPDAAGSGFMPFNDLLAAQWP
ncbi:o-succinylbenzoate synthase [Thiohalocapsa halophila]